MRAFLKVADVPEKEREPEFLLLVSDKVREKHATLIEALAAAKHYHDTKQQVSIVQELYYNIG